MAIKTLHIVQGLSRTPLLFIPQYLTKYSAKKTNPENRKSGSLTNQVEVSLFVSARTVSILVGCVDKKEHPGRNFV